MTVPLIDLVAKYPPLATISTSHPARNKLLAAIKKSPKDFRPKQEFIDWHDAIGGVDWNMWICWKKVGKKGKVKRQIELQITGGYVGGILGRFLAVNPMPCLIGPVTAMDQNGYRWWLEEIHVYGYTYPTKPADPAGYENSDYTAVATSVGDCQMLDPPAPQAHV